MKDNLLDIVLIASTLIEQSLSLGQRVTDLVRQSNDITPADKEMLTKQIREAQNSVPEWE